MTRAPQEVFAHHGKALAAGDLDEIVADYAEDSVVSEYFKRGTRHHDAPLNLWAV